MKSVKISNQPSVLVVADDPQELHSFANALRANGFEVATAASSLAALDALEASSPIDLLIIDLGLKTRPHGFALGRMATLRRLNLPVIYLAGDLPNAYVEGMKGAVLRRPVEIGEVVAIAQGLTQTSQAA